MDFRKIVVARGGSEREPWGIDFLPDVKDGKPVIIWRGTVGPGQVGARLTAEKAIGDFHSDFVEMNAAWFLPILEKLSNLEIFDFHEVLGLCKDALGYSPDVVVGPMCGTCGASSEKGQAT